MDDDTLLFALDSPKEHRVRFGGANRFRGLVFDTRGVAVLRLETELDGTAGPVIPVDRESPDVGRHLPRLESAMRCRFDSEIALPDEAGLLSARAVGEDGSTRPLFDYDLAGVRRSQGRLAALSRALASIPAPPGEIVLLTQGHTDSEAYQDSILPGLEDARRYLDAAGTPPGAIRSILDFGCGSGRLLVGWHLDDPARELTGCDPSAELVGWARTHLPDRLRFDRSPEEPPLPYPDAGFDLVTAVSVFTHLGFDRQERWAEELHRIVKPGGALLLTLHGLPYVRLFLPDRLGDYERTGHLELDRGVEGSNAFSSFHAPAAVRALFRGFDLAAHFPAGRIRGRPVLFPIAAWQDVYVLRRRG